MEIKVGDKVRVSKDAPRELICGIDYLYTEIFSEVIVVAKGIAKIKMEIHGTTKITLIPCKHLIKVEDEEKEPKLKRGDRVRYIGDTTEYKGKMFVIDGNIFFNDYFNQWQASSIKTDVNEVWGVCNVPLSDLEPYTGPTESKSAEKEPRVDRINCAEQIRQKQEAHQAIVDDLVSRAPFMVKEDETRARFIPKIMFNTEYWVKYEADLAKDITLKIVGSQLHGNKPQEIGKIAVEIAKSVVEELKRK